MPDKDSLPSRGIPFRALVDANGVAVGGTATIAQLRQRGMQPVCQVDSSGVHSGGSTKAQLRSRGIPVFCEVNDSGVDPVSGATLAQLCSRGIPAACMLDENGVGGSSTMAQLRQRGIPHFCPLDENGDATTLAPDVTAPTITSAAAANCAENVTLAHALTANEAVTWSLIGGADQARFEISGSTLRWLGNGTKDFEAPDDSGANNTYVVDVRATDTALNTVDQTITITVTDVVEGAVTVSFLGVNSSAGDLTVYDFTSLALGDATNFMLEVAARSGGTPSISSVTLHVPDLATDPTGSPMAEIAGISGVSPAYIFRIARGGASTGDVRITFSAGCVRCFIARYKMTAYSGSPVTGTSTAAAPTATLDVPVGGAVMGIGITGTTTTSTPTNLTEDHEGLVGGENATATCGSNNSASGSTVFTFTFGGSVGPAGAFAAFGP